MAYTDIDKPSDYFTAFKWTGNGASSRALTGVGFQGDMLWSKPNTGHNHYLVDRVRGVDNKSLIPDATTAEDTTGTHGHFDSIDADGFTGTLASGGYNFNRNALEFIAWIWKAGTTFTNDASSTGIGSIDSTGSVNTDAGFSIVSWTGDGNTSGTIKHGLSTAPAMIISKNRDGAENWFCYHKSLGATKYIRLNITNAAGSATSIWNDTEPTTSVFTVGNDTSVNSNNVKYIAYCFADVQGYSKVSGSYVGNGNADGPFAYTGFKPAFIMIKQSSAARDWIMVDNKRNTFNVVNNRLFPNSSDAQNTSVDALDFTSNGFKIRNTNTTVNVSGGTYIFMCFAENPFVSSTGVPATAR